MSASSAGNIKKTKKPAACRFFSKPGGCKSGDKCKFSHESSAQPEPAERGTASGPSDVAEGPQMLDNVLLPSGAKEPPASMSSILGSKLLAAVKSSAKEEKTIDDLSSTLFGDRKSEFSSESSDRSRILGLARPPEDRGALLPPTLHSSLFLSPTGLQPPQQPAALLAPPFLAPPRPPGIGFPPNLQREGAASASLSPPPLVKIGHIGPDSSLPTLSTAQLISSFPHPSMPSLAPASTLSQNINQNVLGLRPPPPGLGLINAPREAPNTTTILSQMNLTAASSPAPAEKTTSLNGDKDAAKEAEAEPPRVFRAPPATQKNKASALLSMLKSKAGVNLNKKSPPPVPEERVEEAEPEAAMAPVPAAPVPKKSFFRTTKNKCGSLTIKVKNMKTREMMEAHDGFYMHPNNGMTVSWTLSVEDYDLPDSADIAIALLRYGSQVNTPSIIAKSVQWKQSHVEIDDDTGSPVHCGSVQFFAPKSAGQFVFRLFDKSSRESSLNTLAFSVQFSVVLVDSDIVFNLQHVIEAFEEKLPLKAISQFATIVKGIKSCNNNNTIKEVSNVLGRCIERTLEQINSSLVVLEEGDAKKKSNASAATVAGEEEKEDKEEADVDEEDVEFWKEYRLARRLHTEAHDALLAIIQRKTPWYFVPEKLKGTLKSTESLYCPILKRFFRNNEELLAQRVSTLQFAPASLFTNTSHKETSTAIDNAIRRMLPSLVPKEDFAKMRDTLRLRLENDLKAAEAIPQNAHLELYGSSANGFGSDGADVDMCLVLPEGKVLSADEKVALIEGIGEALRGLDISSINVRSTARIPIVQFHDTLTGLECDISLHNSLAVANTRLLHLYSILDPRVRCLAYIVKNWAKKRHINSPMDGTLSSYGYVLTILHFLQNRQVPLIPSLQQLPPSWPQNIPYREEDCKRVSIHPVDKIPCNTYFFTPNKEQYVALRQTAAQNRESLAELLIEYFRYFAWLFDFRSQVVSVRTTQPVMKLEKYEKDAWFHTDNLSIEDPFETWYDVAHVIKAHQMNIIRKEYLRAFTLLCRAFQPSPSQSVDATESLPVSIAPDDVIDLMCAEFEDASAA